MRQTGKRIWQWSIGGILLIGTIVVITVFTPRNRNLLEKSTRITNAPDQASTQYAPSRGAHYLWLSDRQALALTFEGKHDDAAVLERRTGVKTPWAALNHTLSSITPNGEQYLSPDGKWVLWTGIRNAQISEQYGRRYVTPKPGLHFDDYRVVATTVDGSRQIDRQQGGNLAWLPDSQGWVQLFAHPDDAGDMHYFVERQSFSSQEKTAIALPELTLKTASPRIAVSHSPIQLLGMLPNNHLLTYSLSRIERREVATIYDIALGSNAPSVQRYTIPLPADWSATDLKLSPAGDRLAWKAFGRRKRFPDFLAKFTYFARQNTHPAFSLWVSNVDGSNLHKVGEEDAPPVDGWDRYLYDLSWLPDGIHLSFIFRGALWTVPVD